jgi:hypothetical protein
LPPLDIIIEIGKRAIRCPNIGRNIDSLTHLAFKDKPEQAQEAFEMAAEYRNGVVKALIEF